MREVRRVSPRGDSLGRREAGKGESVTRNHEHEEITGSKGERCERSVGSWAA